MHNCIGTCTYKSKHYLVKTCHKYSMYNYVWHVHVLITFKDSEDLFHICTNDSTRSSSPSLHNLPLALGAAILQYLLKAANRGSTTLPLLSILQWETQNLEIFVVKTHLITMFKGWTQNLQPSKKGTLISKTKKFIIMKILKINYGIGTCILKVSVFHLTGVDC